MKLETCKNTFKHKCKNANHSVPLLKHMTKKHRECCGCLKPQWGPKPKLEPKTFEHGWARSNIPADETSRWTRLVRFQQGICFAHKRFQYDVLVIWSSNVVSKHVACPGPNNLQLHHNSCHTWHHQPVALQKEKKMRLHIPRSCNCSIVQFWAQQFLTTVDGWNIHRFTDVWWNFRRSPLVRFLLRSKWLVNPICKLFRRFGITKHGYFAT